MIFFIYGKRLGPWDVVEGLFIQSQRMQKNGRRIELHAISFNDYLDPGMAVSGECF